MFETLKVMQKQGIFKLLPNDGLDSLISSAKSNNDIDSIYDDIQKYLKYLDSELAYKHGVSLSGAISSFNDKFSYEMFDLAFTCTPSSKGIYEKEIEFGKAGSGRLGLERNATFTLEERKLLKLINHYYISNMGKDSFKDDYCYIPMIALKLIFSKENNSIVKEEIINTCHRLNNKTIYWDLEKTRYNKKLSEDKLSFGSKEKIVDINILYLAKKNKNGINGEANEIKGVFCKITKFMKLRYVLNQISNRFPIANLKAKYLPFIIAEKIDYRIHMLKRNKKTLRIKCTRNLRDLADEIYLYKNGKQHGTTYLYEIGKANSKRTIIEVLEAIMIAVSNLDNIRYTDTGFIVKESMIGAFTTRSARIDRETEYIQKTPEEMYDKINRNLGGSDRKARVKKFLKDGYITLSITI